MKNLTRREMLGVAGAGTLLAASARSLRAGETVAAPIVAKAPNSASYRFHVGDYEAISLVTGFMDMVPAKPPALDEGAYRVALAALDYTGKLRLHYNILLLRTGQENILIDAGPGGNPPAPFNLVANLAGLGLRPSDITAVLITHAHFDHIGGLLDAEGKVVFSNAEHFCLPEEFDFWTAEKPDFSKLRMKPDGMHQLARQIFATVPFTRIRRETHLPGDLRPFLSPGHTPGHMTLEIRSDGEVLHHIADLIHHSALLARPDWPVISDIDGEQAVATRLKVFKQLESQGTRIFGCHLPFPAVGRIKEYGTGYRWVPDLWDAAAG